MMTLPIDETCIISEPALLLNRKGMKKWRVQWISFLGLVNFNEQIQPWWVRKMRESLYTSMTNSICLAS